MKNQAKKKANEKRPAKSPKSKAEQTRDRKLNKLTEADLETVTGGFNGAFDKPV